MLMNERIRRVDVANDIGVSVVLLGLLSVARSILLRCLLARNQRAPVVTVVFAGCVKHDGNHFHCLR
jgi:hypothetical protein